MRIKNTHGYNPMSYFMFIPVRYSKTFLLVFLTTACLMQTAQAQVAESSDLFITLAEKDSILFDQGFNECNLTATESLISEDLEFYHDVAGVQDKEDFFKAIRENICSGAPQKPIRKLVSESLEVFTLKNGSQVYGAIQKGIHEFYIKEPGKEQYQTGIAKFTHVWILKEGGWKLKTVLSYDHQSPQ